MHYLPPADDEEELPLPVLISDKTTRALHRQNSGGADDWEVFTHSSGMKYVGSPSHAAPSMWVGHVLQMPQTLCTTFNTLLNINHVSKIRYL